MLILVSIEKIKCIQDITATTMYPLYIVIYQEFI